MIGAGILHITKLMPIITKSPTPNFGKNNAKVSVIVPIYNQERYLPTALDSLQCQTLKDSEFICVNDGSRDNSLKILEERAGKDKRIKIINQKNQGAGCSRNNGLKAATGEFVGFMDPDDWIDPETLESLYNKAKRQNNDMVVFNFKMVDENGNVIKKPTLKERFYPIFDIKEDRNFSWKDIRAMGLNGLHAMAWNKLLNRDFVKKHGLHFTQSSLSEDNVFSIGATLNADRIGYSPEHFYNYLQRPNSAIRSKSDKNLSIFQAIDSVKKLLAKMNLTEELGEEFDDFVLKLIRCHARQIVSKDKFRDICRNRLTAKQNAMINGENLLA